MLDKTKTEVTPDMLKADLMKVHDILVKKGWIQGPFQSPEGVCLAQATYSLDGDDRSRFFAVRGAIKDLVGMSVIYYNELEGRTKEEVLAMLKEAASKEYTQVDVQGYIDNASLS